MTTTQLSSSLLPCLWLNSFFIPVTVPSVHPAIFQSKCANTNKQRYGMWCLDKLIHPCELAFQMLMSQE